MATYNITAPDGRKFKINAPDGASKDEVLSFAQSKFNHRAEPAEAETFDPTQGMSTTEKVLAGAGKAMVDIGRGFGQLGRSAMPDTWADHLGLPKQEDIDEAKRLDAALMDTTAGKVGNFIGNVATAAPLMLVPGANTTAGAALVGGATGFVQPVASDESRLANTAIGASLGAVGQKVGKAVSDRAGRAFDATVKRLSSERASNVVRDATVEGAKAAGYVMPPSSVNPSMLNRALEGFSGKIMTEQAASGRNQAVTNALARQALGLAEDAPLTNATLTGLRGQAGKAYEVLKGSGVVKADKQFFVDLDAIAAKYQGAGKDFPDLAQNEVVKLVQSLKRPEFGADSAVDAIAVLRANADKAFGARDAALGKASRDAATAIESALGRHLEASGADKAAIEAFKQARQQIAKTYSVQKALNDSTGNVNARALAELLRRGKPLSGELEEVARFAQAFPKAAQEINRSGMGITPLDFALSAGTTAASGNPAGFAWLAGRPAVRAALLSQPWQRFMTNPPSYTPSYAQQLAAALRALPADKAMTIAGPAAYTAGQ